MYPIAATEQTATERTAATQQTTTSGRVVSRRATTFVMSLCAAAGVIALGAANAAQADELQADTLIPSLVVKFDPQSLSTDAGARALYRRLVRAANEVCPDIPTGSRFLSNDAVACRERAIASVVKQIDSPRLAALDTNHAHRG